MRRSYSTAPSFSGGRTVILFLLFALAIYQLATTGLPLFAAICILPVLVILVILAFRNGGMLTFWALMIINYFIQWKSFPVAGIPTSIPNEMLEILLLIMAIIDVKENRFERAANLMLFALIVWACFCTIELFNDTCGLGMQVGPWYTGARMMAFQLIYAILVYSVYLNTPKVLVKYLYVWGALSLFAVFWVWKQQHLGMTVAENAFLQGRGRTTHLINGGTTIRFFSTFSDAANFGVNMAATAVSFLVMAISTKIRKHRKFFLIVGLLCIWGMFQSGTRTAIFCLFGGLGVYVVLSKSVKIGTPVAIGFLLAYIFLAHTEIANGNAAIRRMRSAFDKDDASANQRTINQEVMKKYLADAPFGIGIGVGYENVPANNKFRKLATLPPDSEYVFIWQHTGIVGICIFIGTTLLIWGGACWLVLFRIRNDSLRGLGAAFCCSFVSMHLGGYANQVLMQFPNSLLFYGGISLVYTFPYIEREWGELEQQLLTEQAEEDRKKEEAKRAKRV